MPTTFRPYCPDQGLLLPPDMKDWLPEGHSAQVSSNASDQGQLVKPLDELKAIYGKRPATVLADAGYCNESDLGKLEALGVDGYVVLGREGRRKAAVDAHKYPAKARMAAKLATESGRAQYAERK